MGDHGVDEVDKGVAFVLLAVEGVRHVAKVIKLLEAEAVQLLHEVVLRHEPW